MNDSRGVVLYTAPLRFFTFPMGQERLWKFR